MTNAYDALTDGALGSLNSIAIDRRTVLFGTAAAALLPAVAEAGSARPQTIRFVIADRRYSESVSFARVLTRQGATALDVAGGLTSLWQEKLAPHWRNAEGAVAGMTTRGVWDCLSEQAQTQFRKPRLIGRHSLDANRVVLTHRIAPPHVLPLDLAPHRIRGRDWPAEIAQLIERCAAADAPCGAEHRIGPARDGTESSQSLVSWIIV